MTLASASFGLTPAQSFHRAYLLDSLISDVTTLQKHGWLPNTHFDQVLQYLNFEKTNPSAARNGAAPSGAGAGVPLSQSVSEGTYVTVGAFRVKTYQQKKVASSSLVSGPSAPSVPVGSPLVSVLAIADFESEEPGDLPFKSGDVIQVLGDVDENWYRGRLRAMEGIFPKSFVQPVSAQPPPLPRRM
ncbi:uncharacterized protein SPPG_01106 [Spizellomyces punctatus DAOM BR117]|uniref:SH3 domain-containing protein n=1 Tax=Spizellomyces punctatus (strain DAOM BR117) TaxID=645134 RepID=A0A0L0HQG9_SPIPD|nr:uncharacterized protein SPPG_01106 [Spizellomyces punctatus DAOM BR117]KND03631.1 hypothetical protein SPPG_01106 [Spizellomyces punctatus DAOM BR117]|eukprot:XP_016611670.1 hypothetical protein SPPG_01106 [Spizellomyces punctatus DAOM BR117]